MKHRILFLCETNGVHSPIAEALLNRIDPDHFEAMSAGTSCGALHPFAIEVMKEIGIDLNGRVPKRFSEIAGDKFDYVITLDSRGAFMYGSRQGTETIHWNVDDPIAISSNPETQLRAFRMVRDQIAQRLRLFVIVHVRPQVPSMPTALSETATRNKVLSRAV